MYVVRQSVFFAGNVPSERQAANRDIRSNILESPEYFAAYIELRLTMPTPANYKQVLHHFDRLPEDVRSYFPTFKELVEKYSWDVSIAYVFSRLERVKHETIYCGIVKLHRTESSLTRDLIDKDQMDRRRFRELFKTVYGVPIDKALLEKLGEGEAVRDRVIHGKIWNDAQARTALIDVLDFCAGFNALVEKLAGFRPFGDLRGFKGRKEPLSKETTRWVLRGMGIPGKREGES